MKKILLPCMLVFFAAAYSVPAETYRWIDGNGTVNFTEDFAKIPKKYRKKAKALGGVEAEVTGVVTGDVKKEVRDKESSTAPGSPAEAKSSPMYGGKSGDQWKEEFRRLNAEKEEISKQIEERRAKLADSAKLSRIQYLQTQAEIRDLETSAKRLSTKQSETEYAASRAGVPYDVRR